MTDFEHEKVRDLNLYVRPLEGRIMEREPGVKPEERNLFIPE